MKRLSYIKKPVLLLKMIFFKMQFFLLKKIINGANAWQLFDRMHIEGFGVNIIRLYFPIYYDKKTVRESFSKEAKNQIAVIFETNIYQKKFSALALESIPEILKLTKEEANKNKPYLDNYYFGVFDAAVLSAMMQSFKPLKLVEIGSGISTRYMKLFKDRYALETEIICIDPFPRAEISGVADFVFEEPLESAIEKRNFNLQSGDFVFLDGSHYIFQGNDTLTFFFKFLPNLNPGVVIHIHDIYLPFDYAEDVARQLWTEQYIVAAMLLSGFKGFEILYPAYYISQTDEHIMKTLENADELLKPLNFKLKTNHKLGFSFWMRKV